MLIATAMTTTAIITAIIGRVDGVGEEELDCPEEEDADITVDEEEEEEEGTGGTDDDDKESDVASKDDCELEVKVLMVRDEEVEDDEVVDELVVTGETTETECATLFVT